MNQQDKSFLTTFTTIMAVLVMIAVAIFMISRLVAVMAAKPDDGSRRLAAIEERIEKVGDVALIGSPAPADSGSATASPAAPQQVAAVAAPSGEAIYNQACVACHASGVLQAPMLGSKEQWEPRYAQGMDTLVHNAVNGIRAMPAKGGHPNLTEDEIRISIVYMLQESGIEVAEAVTQVAEAPSAAAAAEPATAPAQESAPAPTATAEQPAAAQPAPPVVAETAPTTGKSQSVQEVTMAAAEAANAASQAAAAASQAAAAASQAAAAASQAAAAASQAAAAVSQAIDMLREMASTPEPSQAKPTLSAPAKQVKPSNTLSAPIPQPAKQPEPAAPALEKAPAKAAEVPHVLSGPSATAPKKPAPPVEAKPSKPAPVEKIAPPPAPAEPVAVAPQEQAATTPPAEPAPAAVDIALPSDIQLVRGKQLYSTACVICHQAGVAGAPKLGDKAAWAPRLTQGFDVLVEHSIKGYKGMPPKGGRLDIPNREIRSAVGYMLSELE